MHFILHPKSLVVRLDVPGVMESRPRLAIGDVVRLRPPPMGRDRTKLVGVDRAPTGGSGYSWGGVGGEDAERGGGGVDWAEPEGGKGPLFEVQVRWIVQFLKV